MGKGDRPLARLRGSCCGLHEQACQLQLLHAPFALSHLSHYAVPLPDNDMNVCYRRSTRLKGYDYAQAGAYFVTICTHDRSCLFGNIADGEMCLNAWGIMATECWHAIPHHFPHVVLDEAIIMPNHLHGIIVIQGRGEASALPIHVPKELPKTDASPLQQGRPNGTQPGSLSAIVQNFKSISTRRINGVRGMPGTPVWQRNYYEHVIRNERELEKIREYVATNPLKWALDRENPQRTGSSPVEDSLFDLDHAP
jgi:putative transposase